MPLSQIQKILPSPVKEVLSRLRRAGYECYLVGGCLRDILMGRQPHDWDITTAAHPLETKAAFPDAQIIETGLRHGSVTVCLHHLPMEITTYRIDGHYSDGRHPDCVAFTNDLTADLSRRDFTVNAVAYHPTEGLIDPFGGRKDIENRIIRCVGSPVKRFSEDSLRILRALRFASVLGFTLENNTAAALHSQKNELQHIAAERILSELKKLLCGSQAGTVLTKFRDVLTVPIPELEGLSDTIWKHTVQTVICCPEDPALRFSALLHHCEDENLSVPSGNGTDAKIIRRKKTPVSTNAIRILHRLRADNALCASVSGILIESDTVLTGKADIRRLLGRIGPSALFSLTTFLRAHRAADAAVPIQRMAHSPWQNVCESLTEALLPEEIDAIAREIIRSGDCCSLKDLAVKGEDLLSLGYRGREIGETLALLLEQVIQDALPNDKSALLAFAQSRKNDCGMQ